MRKSVLFTLVVVCAVSAAAQVRETVNVDITNVDVVVTDARGKSIRGLTKDEFEVFEGGKLREVTNLAEVSAALPAGGGAAAAAQAPSRAVLIFFDNTSLTLANRRRAADATKIWMTEQLRPVDRIAVMTAIPSLQLRQRWTFDSRAAATAIEAIAGESTSTNEQQRREAQSRVDGVVYRAKTAGPNEPVRFDEATQAVRAYAAAAMRDQSAIVSAMRAALNYFPGQAHKKVMIIVGEGITTNPGSELFQYLNSIKMDIESGAGPALLRAGARNASPLTEASEYDIAPAIRAFTRSAIRDGIMLYAINPGQNENSAGQVLETGPSDLRAQFANAAGNRAGYELLVHNTGGAAYYGAPPGGALAQISSDLDQYYSLGYKSSGAAGDTSLVIKSKSGYRVRATRAPTPQSSDDRMREAVLAHHFNAPISNDLRIALAADPPVTEGDRRKVHLKVSIPIQNLQFDRDGDDVLGGFVVYVSSGDENGSATKVNRQEHQIRWHSNELETMKSKTITFAVDVMVPPGLTHISVGVMDERSLQTGFDRVNLGV